MSVDGARRDKWLTYGKFYMLSSSRVFVGGSGSASDAFPLPGAATAFNRTSTANFVGCLKKVSFACTSLRFHIHTCRLVQVEYKADSLHLPLLEMAKDGHGLLKVVGGGLDFRCRASSSMASEEETAIRPAVAFTSGDASLVSY